jgi:hypothetical protein
MAGQCHSQKTIRDRQHERIVEKKRNRLEFGSKRDKAPSIGMGLTRRWTGKHFGLLRRPINRRNLIMTMMSVPLE